jgi:hypothetical protein
LSFAFFLVLAYIALYVNDQFVRPFLGDVIVVGWLYVLLKSFIKLPNYKLAHIVLFIAYSVEVAQFFNFVSVIGLQHIKAVRIIFGATFDWLDLLGYTIGWVCILLVEYYLLRLKSKQSRAINSN